jgi:putative addiction module component (TIGR02574 family)
MLDSGQVSTMTSHEELLALPVADKLDLIELLWDSLRADEKDNLPLPGWHREELDRRLDELEKNPDDSIPWEDVKRRLISGE